MNGMKRQEPIDHRTAIDEIEPEASENAFRDAAKLCLTVLDEAADSVIHSEHPMTAAAGLIHYVNAAENLVFRLRRYHDWIIGSEKPLLAAYQGALAMGLPCCGEGNFEAVAKKCGVGLFSPGKGRAAVSKGVTLFQTGNNLRPSAYQKGEGVARTYRDVRFDRVKRGHNKAA